MQLPYSTLATLLSLGLVATLNGSNVVSIPSISTENSLANREAHLRAITVRVLSNKKGIGSGTIVAVDRGIYRVITNRHVLPQRLQSLAVQTADRKVHQVRVLAQPKELGLDLALLEFTSGNNIYVTARRAKRLPKVGDVLMAAGFPYSSKESDKASIDRGQVFYLPTRPLADGYQIGHQANVQKGMSGGPAINSQGELMGINGIHAQPLWEAIETYADGTEVEEPLQSQIPEVSWAIPVQRLGELGIKP
jgi:S1-C subfamily serine protease